MRKECGERVTIQCHSLVVVVVVVLVVVVVTEAQILAAEHKNDPKLDKIDFNDLLNLAEKRRQDSISKHMELNWLTQNGEKVESRSHIHRSKHTAIEVRAARWQPHVIDRHFEISFIVRKHPSQNPVDLFNLQILIHGDGRFII